MAKTSIQVDKETRNLLSKEGKFGESFDTLLVRLLKELWLLRNGKK